MRTFQKLTMTLALLIMAVSGAWAANTYTITFAANGNTKTVENVTLPKTFQCSYENADGELDLILKELHGWSWTGNANQTFCDPETTPQSSDNNKVVAGNDNGNHYITIDNVFEGTATITGTFVVNNNGDKPYSLDISIVAVPPTEWDLTSQDGKNWILDKMPANNIELQVEYFAESNLFLSKNALADKANIAVTAGDLGVQFGNNGKSANTITEGTPMTVKYNGTKKVIGFKVEKKAAVDPAKAYLTWDADQKKLVATEIPAEATKVENADEDVDWTESTYVVEGNVTIDGNITLNRNVNLIIKDGATLTANKIMSYNNNNLSIYGQAQMTGELVVNSSIGDAITSINTLEVHSAKVTAASSANNCGGIYGPSTFNVYGGLVDAKVTGAGWGISLNGKGKMNIHGGEVKAEGKGTGSFSYGIRCGNTATVTVSGGKLWAGNADQKALNNVNLQKGEGFSGKIEYSSDNSTWSETVDADAKYVRVGY